MNELINSAEIAPICLAPSTESDHVGDILLASGWGLDRDGNFKFSNQLITDSFKNDHTFILLKQALLQLCLIYEKSTLPASAQKIAELFTAIMF